MLIIGTAIINVLTHGTRIEKLISIVSSSEQPSLKSKNFS